jgi:hypothetical protein
MPTKAPAKKTSKTTAKSKTPKRAPAKKTRTKKALSKGEKAAITRAIKATKEAEKSAQTEDFLLLQENIRALAVALSVLNVYNHPHACGQLENALSVQVCALSELTKQMYPSETMELLKEKSAEFANPPMEKAPPIHSTHSTDARGIVMPVPVGPLPGAPVPIVAETKRVSD